VRPARLAIVLVVVSAWSLHAQWDHRYPPVKGIVNGVYLEEFELPRMGAGPTDPAPAPTVNRSRSPRAAGCGCST
jgi:hypothetical protein